MILFKAVTNEELLNRINNSNHSETYTIRGKNTFNYDPNIEYLHFFRFAEHAFYYKKAKRCVAVLECIIPNEIIEQYGFGFYGDVKTDKNESLASWYIPLPEYIIKANNFKTEYIYDINDILYNNYIQKRLNHNDNEKYGEPIERELLLFNIEDGYDYRDFSYSEIYYEMLYTLLKKENFNIDKVTKILLNSDLNKEILSYFENSQEELLKLINKKEKTKDRHNNKFKQKILNKFNR